MASVSGLSWAKRKWARRLAVVAARLGVQHEPSISYSQFQTQRWEGIARRLKAYRGEYPRHADCSSFTTWCLWNGLSHWGVRDTVNGTNWQWGFTGTQRQHGKPVKYRVNWRSGDLVHYGSGPTAHVAIYVGRGNVVSHGSEGGPMVLKAAYRPIVEVRRHI